MAGVAYFSKGHKQTQYNLVCYFHLFGVFFASKESNYSEFIYLNLLWEVSSWPSTSFTLTPLVFSITCTCRSAFGFSFCVYIILLEAFSLNEDLSEMVRNGIGYI